MADLLYQPVTEILRQMNEGELTPVDLMDTTLKRIESVNEKLNAFVALRDEKKLMEDARAAAKRFERGEARSLEGIPLGVKDLEDAEGLTTTHGSLPFREHMPERDSVQVERLKAAGAIVVGKTNAPEFGYTAITKNLLYGVTRNPWDLERTPGGSSGGSSAAIAGGMISMVTGSDGGGSIRLPATFTGCFGLKPSFGRIPNEPGDSWITNDTSVLGPLTRTVEDAALHMDAAVGVHPLDPNSLPHPGYSYRDILTQIPSNMRIGFTPDLGFAVVQSDIAEIVAGAANVFEELGHRVEPVKGGPPEQGQLWGLVNAFELVGKLSPFLPEHEKDFGRSFLSGVKLGREMTPEIWFEANKQRQALNLWCTETFRKYDLLLTPTTIFDPPPAKGPFPAEIEGREVQWGGVAGLTIPFNLSWHPAATVRAGFSKAGLPVGLQIVAPRHRDDLVLQAAYAFEQARPWRGEWPEI